MAYKILACGSNGSCQLGLGNDEDQSVLNQVPDIGQLAWQRPKSFAFGGNHTMILFPSGHVYAAGSNQYGQCGVESPRLLETFTEIPGRWKHVAAGWNFSVLCNFHDEVFTCGHGPRGELGLGATKLNALAPEPLKLPQKSSIASIEASVNHTVVQFVSGQLLGWGVCRKGQLGPQPSITTPAGKAKPLPCLWEPKLLDLPHVSSFCLGRDRTVLVSDKNISIIGVDSQTLDVYADKVRSMWSSIHYTEKHARGPLAIRSVGNNSHGQCFAYNNGKAIVDFEVGSEHGLVSLEDNSVCAWGWGEHGNCGQQRRSDVTFSHLSPIYEGNEQVVMLAGGQATSWVVTRAVPV